MPLLVLLIGLGLPLLELTVLIMVGQAIGFWKLVLVLILTAFSGAALLYWQGWTTMRRAHGAVLRGEPPVEPMIDGMLIVLAGILLITPGLLTDVAALVLLLPPLRRAIARRMLRHVVTSTGATHKDDGPEAPGAAARPGTADARGPVIEGEFERLDEKPIDRASRRPRDNRSA